MGDATLSIMRSFLLSMMFLIFTTIGLPFYTKATEASKPDACNICTCSPDKAFVGVFVQCSGRNLTRVPQKLPKGTTTLRLDNNHISSLESRVFIGLNELMRLDISRNHLQELDEDTFVGLLKLTALNLESNPQMNISKFSPNLFKPLKKLLTLKLNNIMKFDDVTKGTSYPDSSLQYLISLEELYIDGLPTQFGPGFSKLVNLRNLTLSGRNGFCYIPVIKNSTFAHVPRVKMLNISNCRTTDTEIMTFSSLKNIHTLDVSLNRDLGFTNLSKSMFGLQDSRIQVLRMNDIFPWYGSCSHLKISHVRYLKGTSLKELYIDSNGIIKVEHGTFSNLPKSLEVLSARENRFSFGEYMLELDNMKSLRSLDISYVNRWRPLPMGLHKKRWHFHIPTTLERFVLSGCNFRGMIDSAFIVNTSLRELIADHNVLSSVSGPVNSFKNVEHIDFSNNALQFVYFGLTSRKNSISYVNLSHNNLGESFSHDVSGDIFQWFWKALHLDLSSNNIGVLPGQLFKGLGKIESLIVAYNNLDKFDVSLSHLTQLSYLDIGYNKIQSLPLSVMNDLDDLGNVTVRLKGNTLSCTCHNLDFLKWMQKTRVFIKDLDTTTCVISNGTNIVLRYLDTVVADLEYQCRSYVDVLIISVSLFILIMFVMFLGFGYRYRWRLRRMYYVGRKKQNQAMNDELDIYTYDAFVSYADADRGFVKNSMIPELEQKAGLRLCIHDRDFIPGTVIASNIANAIQNSKKTLIILSPSFMKSDWCQFEYNMARTEGVSRRVNVIVAVLYRPLQFRELSSDMTALFAQYSYIQYEIDGHDDEVFWRNIIDAIKTPEENEL